MKLRFVTIPWKSLKNTMNKFFMAHELNWTTFRGHEFPMKHHIMETYQESSMMEPWKTFNGSWNKYWIWVMKNVWMISCLINFPWKYWWGKQCQCYTYYTHLNTLYIKKYQRNSIHACTRIHYRSFS